MMKQKRINGDKIGIRVDNLSEDSSDSSDYEQNAKSQALNRMRANNSAGGKTVKTVGKSKNMSSLKVSKL